MDRERGAVTISDRLVTVFGGSGFLGRYVVRALCRAGLRVRVAVRRPDLAYHVLTAGAVGQVSAVQASGASPRTARARWRARAARMNLFPGRRPISGSRGPMVKLGCFRQAAGDSGVEQAEQAGGRRGAVRFVVAHGVVSSALFLCVGVIYDRMHTREIAAYGGLVHRMPRYAFTFLFFTLASVGLPGLSGFVGEFLVLLGAFKANTWVAFLAATGLILGAAYALWLYRKIVFGELTKDSLKGMLDMNKREIAVFLPLVLLTLWMGIYPNSFLDPMAPAVDKLIGDYQAALKLARTAALAP